MDSLVCPFLTHPPARTSLSRTLFPYDTVSVAARTALPQAGGRAGRLGRPGGPLGEAREDHDAVVDIYPVLGNAGSGHSGGMLGGRDVSKGGLSGQAGKDEHDKKVTHHKQGSSRNKNALLHFFVDDGINVSAVGLRLNPTCTRALDDL
jgi:hypothetical protein